MIHSTSEDTIMFEYGICRNSPDGREISWIDVMYALSVSVRSYYRCSVPKVFTSVNTDVAYLVTRSEHILTERDDNVRRHVKSQADIQCLNLEL